jgi:hypothetical protein
MTKRSMAAILNIQVHRLARLTIVTASALRRTRKREMTAKVPKPLSEGEERNSN